MPVTFAQIAANTAKVTIQTGVGPVTVEYYPNKLTEKSVAEMQATQDSDGFMTSIIKSWDIFEDDAFTVMYPIEKMSDFGIPFKVQLIEAMTSNTRPNSPTPQS